MCKDVSEWVESDLKRCIIPRWHDESYLNKWKTLHEDQCNVVRIWDCIHMVYNKDFIPKK